MGIPLAWDSTSPHHTPYLTSPGDEEEGGEEWLSLVSPRFLGGREPQRGESAEMEPHLGRLSQQTEITAGGLSHLGRSGGEGRG